MLAIQTEGPLSEVTAPDIVLVPGGPGDEAAAANPRILEWLRRAHQTTKWTMSVCTGALILAAAGILTGLEATTHARGSTSPRPQVPPAIDRRLVRTV